jgi:hypothetical protein
MGDQAKLVPSLGPRPNDPVADPAVDGSAYPRARETIELNTSHAAFATRPTEVLGVITNAAAAV